MTKEQFQNIQLMFKRLKELNETLQEAKYYLDSNQLANRLIIADIGRNVNLTKRDLEKKIKSYSWAELVRLEQEKELNLIIKIGAHIRDYS